MVADKEWDAIQAAQKAEGDWSDVEAAVPGPGGALRPHPQGAVCASARSRQRKRQCRRGLQDRREGDRGEYEWPFQSHASMGPACALVEIKDGQVTCWTGTQKSHFVQRWRRRARSACRSKGPRRSGRPVRAPTAAMTPATRPWMRPCSRKRSASRCALQYMRDEGTGWDPKGPASIHKVARGLDDSGKVIAYDFIEQGVSRASTSTPMAASRRIRWPARRAACALKSGDGFGVPAESYAFENKRLAGRRSRRCSIASRRCARRICAIRSGRRSTSPANRSWTKWRAALGCRPDRIPAARRQGPARHRA